MEPIRLVRLASGRSTAATVGFDRGQVARDHNSLLRHNSSSPNATLNPAKNPKTIRKYLSILLRSTEESKASTANKGKGVMSGARRTYSCTRVRSVPDTTTSTPHPSLPGMAAPKHHTHICTSAKRHSAPPEVRPSRQASPSGRRSRGPPGRHVAPPGVTSGKMVAIRGDLNDEDAQQYLRMVIRSRLEKGEHVYRPRRSATTTPTAPYSSTDLIGSYNNGTSQYPPAPPDGLHINGNHGNHDNVDTDRSERRRARDAERLSRKDSKRSILAPTRESKGRLPFETPHDREEQGGGGIVAVTSSSSLGQKNSSYFKPLTSRNSFLRNTVSSPTPRGGGPPGTSGPLPQGAPPQTQGSLHTETTRTSQLTGRESEDTLVAMGTNWNPSNAFQRNNGRPGSYSNGTSSSSNNGGSYLSHQLSISQAPTTLAPRHLGKRNTMPHLSGGRLGSRDSEPRYPDAMIGSPATFHQRVSEMAALEAETVRWERTRKAQKKKPRSDT